jgi:hypothetical protein
VWFLQSASDPYRQEGNGEDKMATYFNADTSMLQLVFPMLFFGVGIDVNDVEIRRFVLDVCNKHFIHATREI